MSIVKPYTFVAGTKARAAEVNANFDTLYTQVNSNISDITNIESDITNLNSTKANINGSSGQRFAVANPINNYDAINKQYFINSIGNSIDIISGLTIEKDSGSPEDTIIVNPGSSYDSTHTVLLKLDNITTKQNDNQAASTTYYVYIIGNSTGSSIDILISSSSVTPTLPAGYTLYRQIGSYTTDSNSYIDSILYYGIPSNSPTSIAGIVETYVNGTSWYRVYSDKWCVQGGLASSGNSVTVNLLKQYMDTNYSAYSTLIGTPGSYPYAWRIENMTTSGFDIVSDQGSAGSQKQWLTCGYLA